MANSAGLVRTVAKALMLNEASLAVQMRLLREADIVPTGGRGTGGYAMRPRDAAALTIAAVVTSTLKDTAELTDEFLKLRMTSHDFYGPSRGQQVRDLMPGLDHDAVIRKFGLLRIPFRSDVHSTFATLIEMLITGDMFPPLSTDDFLSPPDQSLDLNYRRILNMCFYLPMPCVTITYIAGRIFREVMTFGGTDRQLNFWNYADLLERSGKSGALRQLRVLPQTSLDLIADAVGQEGLRSALTEPPSRRKIKRASKAEKRDTKTTKNSARD